MASLNDLFKLESIPLAGLGIVALAVPFFVPALRPQFAGALKSGLKLFLEAELGADNALADRLVDASVDCLLKVTSDGTEEHRKEKADREVKRFISKARASAHRRSWDEADAEARYHRHLAKWDAALSRARHRAHSSQHAALAHASDSLAKHRAGPKPVSTQPKGAATRATRNRACCARRRAARQALRRHTGRSTVAV